MSGSHIAALRVYVIYHIYVIYVIYIITNIYVIYLIKHHHYQHVCILNKAGFIDLSFVGEPQ